MIRTYLSNAIHYPMRCGRSTDCLALARNRILTMGAPRAISDGESTLTRDTGVNEIHKALCRDQARFLPKGDGFFVVSFKQCSKNHQSSMHVGVSVLRVPLLGGVEEKQNKAPFRSPFSLFLGGSLQKDTPMCISARSFKQLSPSTYLTYLRKDFK